MRKYYVYYLLDPRNFYLPFYVGKGTGKRAYHHLSETTRNTDNPRKKAVISKIRNAGQEPRVLIVASFETSQDAYDFEEEKIRLFGRRGIDEEGILTNLTASSRPPSRLGIAMSDETKEKIGLANRGKKRTPEVSAKLSEQRKGRRRRSPTPETIEKIRAANLGKVKRKLTEDERKVISERVKAEWRNPDRRRAK